MTIVTPGYPTRHPGGLNITSTLKLGHPGVSHMSQGIS